MKNEKNEMDDTYSKKLKLHYDQGVGLQCDCSMSMSPAPNDLIAIKKKFKARHKCLCGVSIKHRVKSSLALLMIWLSVPAVYAYTLWNNYASSSTTITLGISAIFMIFGIFFYNGNAHLISGFNMMSKRELEEYDLDRISVVSGICWLSISLISFHGTVLVSYSFGNASSVAFTIVTMLAGILTWAVLISGKKYRKT